MLLEFIAAIALGLGVGGLVMAARFVSGRRIASYWVPAAAGASMILMMVYLEYNWAEQTIDRLPEGVVITSKSEDAIWFRPWTYAYPLTLRMVAIDTRRNRTHANQPHRVMTTVILFGRWMPVREIPVIYDCQAKQRADLSSDVSLEEDGSLLGAEWVALADDDKALGAACANMAP